MCDLHCYTGIHVVKAKCPTGHTRYPTSSYIARCSDDSILPASLSAASLDWSMSSSTQPRKKGTISGVRNCIENTLEIADLVVLSNTPLYGIQCCTLIFFRWFCHFDDDEYLNIVNLSKKLNTYNSSADYYVGHWLTKHGNKPKRLGRFRNFPETERKSYFYATGASYCLSSGLMRRVEKYFRGKSFSAACERMALTDDYTIGSVIG